MCFHFLRRGQAALLAVIYGVTCASVGILVDRLIAYAPQTSPEAVTVMALAQTPQPLEQTPVVREIDLNSRGEQAALSIEVIPQTLQKGSLGRILIYHTHTYEAYKQVAEDPYQETEKWRSKDEAHNMVRVGEELSALLTAKGYEVVHDKGAYEPPNLSTSYTRSLKMLEKRVANGETYDLYIDLHRDAYSDSMANRNTVQNGQQQLAKLMMLIGKGAGESYDLKPDWEKNYAIAQTITEELNSQIEGLCRNVSVKTGRFNQHIAPRCILIEAGNNENTLSEVLASRPYLADAIHETLSAMQSD